MSNKIQKLCYKLSLGSKAEKCVFNCLADAADDDGLCWMLVATIVERTGFADRTVRRALTALVESGLIDRQVRGGRSSVFTIQIDSVKSRIESTKPVVPAHVVVEGELRFSQSVSQTSSEKMAGNPAAATWNPATVAPIIGLYKFLNQKTPSVKTDVCVGSQKTDDALPNNHQGFDNFWQAYPRKEAKQGALKAWRRLKPGDSLVAEIMAALKKQAGTEGWRKGFVPHAASWLNGRRWEDVIAPPAAQGGAPGGIAHAHDPARACPCCGDRGTVMVDGAWYCRSHNPMRMAA